MELAAVKLVAAELTNGDAAILPRMLVLVVPAAVAMLTMAVAGMLVLARLLATMVLRFEAVLIEFVILIDFVILISFFVLISFILRIL